MQENYRDDPWGLLVGCILFNMVHGTKALPVLENFLKIWPNARRFLDEQPLSEEIVVSMFRPLGFHHRRYDRIIRMSIDFLDLRPDLNQGVDILRLHGIGKYAADSFNIFCRGELTEDVQDKELRRYVEWAKTRFQGGDCRIPS